MLSEDIASRLPGIELRLVHEADVVVIDNHNGTVEVLKDRYHDHSQMMPITIFLERMRANRRVVKLLWVPITQARSVLDTDE